ncbi:MAG: tRNA lysidine(34) synthetase TilS [Oscillospiraceae bacterium]|nr:tRNA lysidine(34) synthetase TilS [Oscillospiraceae bacterium]
MKRSDLPRRIMALAEEYDMFPAGELVLCAVSGGLDSMCLLSFLYARGVRTAAAHFHHGLRGADADGDEAFVRAYCEQRDIPFRSGRADVAAYAREHGLGVEEAGRRLRYAFLDRSADELGAARIATAHHADDNLETFLLHLTRGTGPAGLCGIAPRQGRLVRPLLHVSRSELEEWAAEHDVPYRQDATNDDTRLARNRIRHEVVPVLRALNPRLTEHAVQTMDALRADEMYLKNQALRAIAGATPLFGGLAVHAKALNALPAAVGPRAIRLLLDRLEASRQDVTAVHYRAVLELSRGDDPSAHLDLPHGITADRVGSLLLLTVGGPLVPELAPTPLSLEDGAVTKAGGWLFTCIRTVAPDGPPVPDVWYLDPGTLGRELLIRPRQTGDALRFPGRGQRSLKRAMIDQRIPRLLRDTLPILTDEHGVVAAALLGADESRLAKPGTEAVRLTVARD